MKYFTPELWASWQEPGHVAPPPEADPFLLYRRELEGLRDRLLPEPFAFFAEADVHDGELLSFAIIDGSRPSPLDQPSRPWHSDDEFPVRVELRLLDAREEWLWTINYLSVRRVQAQYDRPLEPCGGFGFGDWGYHELSDAGGGLLRHEVLFRSESTLLVEFKDVAVLKQRVREAAEQPDAAAGALAQD